MKIDLLMDGVSGAFDTQSGRLVSVPNPKYAEVLLCFAEQMNIPFAKIKLHDRDRYVDAKAVFDDAAALGELIAERWNNSIDKDSSGGIVALQREIDGLKEHIERLTAVRVTGLTPDAARGGMVLGLEGGMLQVMADCFAKTFKDSGATNFLSMDFTDDDGDSYTVTMQRSGADTPAAKNARLEEELERLRKMLAERSPTLDEAINKVKSIQKAARANCDSASAIECAEALRALEWASGLLGEDAFIADRQNPAAGRPHKHRDTGLHGKGINGNINMTPAQREWCKSYEEQTGFDALMDDFLDGKQTFEQAAKRSVQWFEDHSAEAIKDLIYYPEEQDSEDE